MFFSDYLEKRTIEIPTQHLNRKITVKKEDVFLRFMYGRVVLDSYKIEFAVTILGYGYQEKLNSLTLDMASYKQAIMDNISESDRKYMILKELTPIKAVFYLDFNKWFDDAINNAKFVRPSTSLFARDLYFKIAPPKMILNDILRDEFGRFLETKFKQYMVKKNLGKKWFDLFLPDFASKSIKIKSVDFFDFSFDIQFNVMRMKLKDVYILMLMYGLVKINDKIKEKDPALLTIDKDVDFINKVKKEAKLVVDKQSLVKFVKDTKNLL